MSFINIEIKARTRKADAIRAYLRQQDAEFRGIDDQTDTYFNCTKGRLKLRRGPIENNLIQYDRGNIQGPRRSDFRLWPVHNPEQLLEILSASLGILVEVKKSREIYYLGNVKIHIDEVAGLGNFVEIEAGNIGNDLTVEELERQCRFYMQAFGVEEQDLVPLSYSDMLLELPSTGG